MTSQLIRFCEIIAWSSLVFGSLRFLVVFTSAMVKPEDATSEKTKRRAEVLWSSTVMVFIASAWFCAGVWR
jgi:alkyl hydroperoxide reductase subunit AhpC